MIKATVFTTSYDFDRDVGTTHVVVQLENGHTRVHRFVFKYSWDECPSDVEDNNNIIRILKKVYGDNIQMVFVDTDEVTDYDIDYRN